MNESARRITGIQEWLARRQLDGLFLTRVSSFAWATCGAASHVNTASSDGAASLLITAGGQHLLTNNIEAPRLEKEEDLKAQGWHFQVSPWHEKNDAASRLTKDLRLAADGFFPGALDVSAEISRLRASLSPEEGSRFNHLGQLCAGAMDSAIRLVRPGMSEHEIAALLATESEKRGVQAIVNLIATDARIFSFRHPLPTARKLEKYLMLVLCGRKQGLVCSVTRLVHFGRLPDDIRRKTEATAAVDAAMIASTRPGRTLGEVFQIAMTEYSRFGYPDEWRLHHQGGPAGYEPREYLATPQSTDAVAAGQAYAWNPSITGTKSEDTVLVGEEENEILTVIEGWPVIPVEVDGQTIERPAILEIT